MTMENDQSQPKLMVSWTSHEPPSSSPTLRAMTRVPLRAYMCSRESVAVNGNVPPRRGYGSGPMPSLKCVVTAAGVQSRNASDKDPPEAPQSLPLATFARQVYYAPGESCL